MPRQVAPLTNTQVTKAKPKEREYNLADGHGLYLRIKPNGSKLWLFNYQAPFTKKRSNISFGKFPEVSIANARREREICRELLANDVDPKHARAAKENAQIEAHANTLRSVAERWFKVKSPELTKGYAEDIWNSLENHLFPKLGNRPVHQILPRDIIANLEPLQDAGKLELVKRLCQRLNMIIDYAVIVDLLDENRLVRVGKAFKNPRKVHLPSIKPAELPELMAAIEGASIRPTTRALMLWQLHTMVRPSEAAGARWDEIDLNEQIWVIPSERMKRRREHVVPLTAQALALLETIKPLSWHREFVFPSDRNPRQHSSSATVNMALRRMGFQGRLVSHGFRSLASTSLNENGFDPDLIESALAHQDKNLTRAAYNRTDYVERRREMMQWWSARLENLHKGVGANSTDIT
ncbi:MAG: integrase domain-containing protein [Pseudohongiellaceae bacterium]